MAWHRELSDSELFDLSQECDRRVNTLIAEGIILQGLDQHYVNMMLEQLLGERGLDMAREKHLLWVKEQLDLAEPKIRQAKLEQMFAAPPQGVPGNGRGRGHG